MTCENSAVYTYLDSRGRLGQIAEEMNELEVREHIVQACRQLHERNLLAAADGNISYRMSDERIFITPSGRPKAFIKMEELCVIDLEGNVISGKPSSERMMHLEVYRQCPQAKAVVHAHPPTAIAWSIARPELQELPSDSLPEVILALGSIPIVPYARPTTAAMADVIRELLPKHRAMILSRHGGLSWGEDLEEAYNGIERIEHISHILKSAVELGGLSVMAAEELKVLRDMRKQFGDKTL